jgi:hypothetical protein
MGDIKAGQQTTVLEKPIPVPPTVLRAAVHWLFASSQYIRSIDTNVPAFHSKAVQDASDITKLAEQILKLIGCDESAVPTVKLTDEDALNAVVDACRNLPKLDAQRVLKSAMVRLGLI